MPKKPKEPSVPREKRPRRTPEEVRADLDRRILKDDLRRATAAMDRAREWLMAASQDLVPLEELTEKLKDYISTIRVIRDIEAKAAPAPDAPAGAEEGGEQHANS